MVSSRPSMTPPPPKVSSLNNFSPRRDQCFFVRRQTSTRATYLNIVQPRLVLVAGFHGELEFDPVQGNLAAAVKIDGHRSVFPCAIGIRAIKLGGGPDPGAGGHFVQLDVVHMLFAGPAIDDILV